MDPLERLLLRDGAIVALPPKAFELLLILVRNSGHALAKEELMRELWAETNVEEANLAQNISVLRKTLGETAGERQFIGTIPRYGYRFVAAVRELSEPTSVGERNGVEEVQPAAPPGDEPAEADGGRRKAAWMVLALVTAVAVGAVAMLTWSRTPRGGRKAYEQITNFPDAAVDPALSSDGRMLAFIRGDKSFVSSGQLYLKPLPGGEPIQLTHDPRLKYNPVFSPDGSQIAYSVIDPIQWTWDTVRVPVFGGGEPRLWFSNASGLTWTPDRRLLFSEIQSGMHMGIVTANESRTESRIIYLPQHERAMAHFSYASPDRKTILIVEMDRTGTWQPCRLVPFDGSSVSRQVGPNAACTAAAFSPDGKWMYFSAAAKGESHLWRQRVAGAAPEQMTFGPAQEEGIAVNPDGRSLITSAGREQNTIWIHDREVERPVSAEGDTSSPRFSRDGQRVYFLLHRELPKAPNELWATDLSGKSERLLPGVSMVSFDISDDGQNVVFNDSQDPKPQLWLAPLNKRSSPKRIASAGEDSAYFGPNGEILFRVSESGGHFLWRMDQNGFRRERVAETPIGNVFSISSDRRWITALSPVNDGHTNAAMLALPTAGGPPKRVCLGGCIMGWAPDGRYVYISVPRQSGATGDLLSIPVKEGESLPPLPKDGIASFEDGAALPGARVIEFPASRGRHWEDQFAFGLDSSVFAYRNVTVHRNLFRIPLK